MSTDLLRKLRELEEDYLGQPLVVQRADLEEINRVRTQLGMPLVDIHLKEVGADEQDVEGSTPEPEDVPDHAEARAIYHAYLRKVEELDLHRAYAERIAKATSAPGQTPVRPLATMGTDGGPLRCDHCGKPIVLEGGEFNGVTADVAWEQNPRNNWRSWILGGMVVEIQINGTLRIYHGYPGRGDTGCCNIASRQDDRARAAFDSSQRSEKKGIVLAFVEHEFPDKTVQERMDLHNDILDVMYEYDPGLGINRPSREGSE